MKVSEYYFNPIKAGPFLGGDQLEGVPCGTPPGIWTITVACTPSLLLAILDEFK